jgi:hypothetical protein
MSDFSRLSLNTATTKKWKLEQAVAGCVKAGIPALGPWRDRVAEIGTERADKLIRRIASYQVCDFNLPIASDALLSRGMMGDGFVDFPTITRWVAEAGAPSPNAVYLVFWVAHPVRRSTSWAPYSVPLMPSSFSLIRREVSL